jgi:hypothetical protein
MSDDNVTWLNARHFEKWEEHCRLNSEAFERACLIESIYKSWCVRVAEATPPGVDVRPTWQDTERLVSEIIAEVGVPPPPVPA